MKRTLIASATLLALSSTVAMAQSYHDQPRAYQEMAQVLSATPIVERISVPRQQCWNEQVAVHDERRVRRASNDNYVRESSGGGSGGGALLGAIIGGVLGHQMGNSSGGRDRGTAAGAILGGVIGSGVESSGSYGGSGNYGGYGNRGGYERAEYDRGAPTVRHVQRCNTVNETQQQIVGYDVRYRIHGRDYTTRMANDPGASFPVSVEVRPAGYRAPAPSYSRY